MSHTPCPICRENHDSERGLSWDGKGVNSCDLYRSRIATVEIGHEHLGPVFAAAPDLLAALEALQGFASHGENKAYWHRMGEEAAFHKALNQIRAAIAKAKGEMT